MTGGRRYDPGGTVEAEIRAGAVRDGAVARHVTVRRGHGGECVMSRIPKHRNAGLKIQTQD